MSDPKWLVALSADTSKLTHSLHKSATTASGSGGFGAFFDFCGETGAGGGVATGGVRGGVPLPPTALILWFFARVDGGACFCATGALLAWASRLPLWLAFPLR